MVVQCYVRTDRNKITTLYGCIGQGIEGLGRLAEVRPW